MNMPRITFLVTWLNFNNFENNFDGSLLPSELDAVGYKVQDYLNESSPISIELLKDVWVSIVKFQQKSDVFTLSLVFNNLKDLLDDLADVEILVVQLEYIVVQFGFI